MGSSTLDSGHALEAGSQVLKSQDQAEWEKGISRVLEWGSGRGGACGAHRGKRLMFKDRFICKAEQQRGSYRGSDPVSAGLLPQTAVTAR